MRSKWSSTRACNAAKGNDGIGPSSATAISSLVRATRQVAPTSAAKASSFGSGAMSTTTNGRP
jgi:hypothetical protein